MVFSYKSEIKENTKYEGSLKRGTRILHWCIFLDVLTVVAGGSQPILLVRTTTSVCHPTLDVTDSRPEQKSSDFEKTIFFSVSSKQAGRKKLLREEMIR